MTSGYVIQGQLISVVVPVYNVCNYLQSCIDSLISQTYVKSEIVLVDDGSSDGSSVICDKAASADKRIRVIHQENKGLSGARNAGTAQANGDWIVYVDSDDVVSPHFLEHLYDAARAGNADVAICKGSVFAQDEIFHADELNQVMTLSPEAAITELLSERRASTAAWGKLAKASIWKSLTFPEGRRFEDMPVTWKVLNMSDSVAILHGGYYGYRDRKASISSSPAVDSIADYATSIRQIWNELRPSSGEQSRAKSFRCCLECCRLLEMIDMVAGDPMLDSDAKSFVLATRKDVVEFLRRRCVEASGDRSAALTQRLRIVLTALFTNQVMGFLKKRKYQE